MNTIKSNYQKVYMITPASGIILYFVSLVFIIVGVKFLSLSGVGMLIGFAFVVLGFVVFLNTYKLKVILRVDSIEIKSIFKRKIIQKHEILYFKKQLSGTNGFHIIGLKPSSKRPIYLPLSLNYDNEFFAWFNGIPDGNNTVKASKKIR
jgi:hypothetical protein